MASVMDGEDGKRVMADDRDEDTEPQQQTPARRDGGGGGGTGGGQPAPAGGGGFFTVYKSGQGYWTRLLTFLGFMVLGALTAHFVYTTLVGTQWASRTVATAIGVALFAVWVFIEYRLLNKPDNADFLIATDSEMKKVNWTSRKELIGSTKVVIFFMFMFVAVIFLIDILFGFVFYWMGILKTNPFGGG